MPALEGETEAYHAPLVWQALGFSEAPYTRLFVAVDPDRPFTRPERVAEEKAKILNEIRDVLKAQGVTRPKPEELNESPKSGRGKRRAMSLPTSRTRS